MHCGSRLDFSRAAKTFWTLSVLHQSSQRVPVTFTAAPSCFCLHVSSSYAHPSSSYTSDSSTNSLHSTAARPIPPTCRASITHSAFISQEEENKARRQLRSPQPAYPARRVPAVDRWGSFHPDLRGLSHSSIACPQASLDSISSLVVAAVPGPFHSVGAYSNPVASWPGSRHTRAALHTRYIQYHTRQTLQFGSSELDVENDPRGENSSTTRPLSPPLPEAKAFSITHVSTF